MMPETITFKQCPEVTFTRASAKDFYKLYEESCIHGNETFKFQDHTFVVTYAKYVIEYLATEKFLPRSCIYTEGG